MLARAVIQSHVADFCAPCDGAVGVEKLLTIATHPAEELGRVFWGAWFQLALILCREDGPAPLSVTSVLRLPDKGAWYAGLPCLRGFGRTAFAAPGPNARSASKPAGNYTPDTQSGIERTRRVRCGQLFFSTFPEPHARPPDATREPGSVCGRGMRSSYPCRLASPTYGAAAGSPAGCGGHPAPRVATTRGKSCARSAGHSDVASASRRVN